jgi:hypothetical protein
MQSCKYYILITLLYLLPSVAGAQSFIRQGSQTVIGRFGAPTGYQRIDTIPHSFAFFLQRLPLLPSGTPVKFYDGVTDTTCRPAAIIDMDISDKNLQQSVQSAIRLWAEYLFEQQRLPDIHFHINNGELIPYEQWAQGMKLVINQKTHWTKTPSNPSQYRTFRRYLNFIFTHSDFQTLLRDMEPVPLRNIASGNVLTSGGGMENYVAMVLDVAAHRHTGEIMVLLVSGGNPAKSMYVLQNPVDNKTTGAWFPVKDGIINTGKTILSTANLYRFR